MQTLEFLDTGTAIIKRILRVSATQTPEIVLQSGFTVCKLGARSQAQALSSLCI